MRPISDKLYGLDHLRALAIVMVFFFHYQNPIFGHPVWVHTVAAFGWTGVDLFFVLSGFLISSQLFARIKKDGKVDLRRFFLKRFFRILPAYAVVVTIYFLFPGFHERERLPGIVRFATFTQNLGLNIKEYGTFSHAWSLCVEEHFYLLVPFILLFLKSGNSLRKGYILLVLLFFSGIAIRIYCWDALYLPHIGSDDGWMYWYKYIYYPTYTRVDGLLAGVSIAALYHFLPTTWSRISRYGNLLILCSLVILTGAYFLCIDQQSYWASVAGFPVVALGYGIMVTGAISPTSFLYKWNSKITSFIAAISYSVYLTHKGIIHLVQKTGDVIHVNTDSNLMLFACTIACILSALMLHLVIEKPFMNLRRKVATSG